VAAVLAVAMVYAATYGLRQLDGPARRYWTWWQCNGWALAMLAAIVVAYLPPARVSRAVRLAVALPVLHALAMVVAVALFALGNFHVARGRAPVMPELVPLVVIALAAGTLGAAWLIARRRRNRPGEVAHAAVTIALANLLLVGLWLPIFARLCAPEMAESAKDLIKSHRPLMLALVVVSPLVTACTYAALAPRRRAWRLAIAIAMGALLAGAVAVRWKASPGPQLLYESFAFVVLAALGIAIAAVIGLGVTTALACRRDRRDLAAAGSRHGVVERADDGELDPTAGIVARVEITSWLRGPRAIVRSFVANTQAGDLAIPAARHAAAIPLSSTVLRSGEAVVTLRTGDAVAIAGLVSRDGDGDPYRDMTNVVPGPYGVVVGAPGPATTPMQSFYLTAWRPSVAYLAIAAAVMVPALTGLATLSR
jgi:hypothetical protein